MKIYLQVGEDGIPISSIVHTLTVDDVYIDPPIPTITYSKTEQTNESVTATISFNKEGVTILNNDGKDTYTFEENGEFTFEYIDENGNTGNAKAIVNNVDKKVPVVNVTYETTDEGVIATIAFDKENVTILNNDGKNTYTFKENGEFTFEFVDEAGNRGTATAKVSNIIKNVDNENNDNNINNENVNTGDIVVYFVIALIMSVVCISITTIYKVKNKINK